VTRVHRFPHTPPLVREVPAQGAYAFPTRNLSIRESLVMPNGTIVTFANKKDKAIIVFSHHTSDTMDNPLIATGASVQPRVLGEDAESGVWGINTAAHIDY